MIEIAWPLVFAALPLPWLVYRFAAPVQIRAAGALRVPWLEDFARAERSGREARRVGLSTAAAALAWVLLVTAASRPEWLGPAVEVPVSGRDLMLAVDLSRSMEQTDFIINGRQVDRLTAAKSVAAKFIERRVGDRIGLILFGSQAYMQVPLTFDRTTVNTLLDEAQIGLAGTQTAIGDAIGLAVKRLRDQPSDSQVLILMTDGSNTAGEVEPEVAARLAADIGLRIHTIGIGADEMLRRSLFGSYRVNPSADLDEVTLAAVAEKTGGRYFRARDVEEFEEIYALIDQMEPVQQSGEQFRPRTPLFPWPLGISLALFAGLATSRRQQLAA